MLQRVGAPVISAFLGFFIFISIATPAHAFLRTTDAAPALKAAVTLQAAPASLPAGLQETVVANDVINPTVVRFAPNGHMFVAEKRGYIREYDTPNDPTPTVVADLTAYVYNFWDRGLLGMVLDPNFATNHTLYVLYTYDADIGSTSPKWGGGVDDPCPTPPGPTTNGCVVSGRLTRIVLDANDKMVGAEQPLINDWCQQFPSHSMGSLEFGQDGALYVSAGEAANFNSDDDGQFGGNPCGDPPKEGGSLRAQDLRAPGDPVSLDGSVLRINPATGAAMADNPLINNPDLNARRILANGFRNPFRFAIRPGTSEVWVADVGNGLREEIDRIPNATTERNYGWPCYEGTLTAGSYKALDTPICNALYASPGATTSPYYEYSHDDDIGVCPQGSSAIAGIAFNPGGNLPAKYDGALFFSDYSRRCLFVMLKGSNGLPDPTQVSVFETEVPAVQIIFGADGALYYTDFDEGEIRKISNTVAPPPPPPPPPSQPPVPKITLPLPSLTWKVGDSIAFAGSATDPEDGTLAATSLSWTLIMHHCPSDCHTHTVQTFSGVASSSFVTPDHEYPSYLELRLTATDSSGVSSTTSVNLQPKTADITLATIPAGLTLTAGTFTKAAPLTQPFIQNGNVSLTAAATQTFNGHNYTFAGWSDGGAANHVVVATTSKTYTAAYTDAGPTGQPDLVVTNVALTPTTPAVGQGVTFSATIKNQGTAATPTGGLIGVGFLVDGNITSWSVDSVANTTPLAAGASVTVVADGGPTGSNMWLTTAGAHTIEADVDDVNRIAESSEANNGLQKTLTVGAAMTNLALNKPAKASSLENPGYPASFAFDNSATTRWSSKFADPQWIYVDLGATHTISGVKLMWEDSHAKSFQIQTSNNASTWTNIYTTTSGPGGVQNITGLSGSGRYVRMNGTVRADMFGYSLWDFQVFGI